MSSRIDAAAQIDVELATIHGRLVPACCLGGISPPAFENGGAEAHLPPYISAPKGVTLPYTL